MPVERTQDWICYDTTAPKWKTEDTEQDVTELVEQLNAVTDFLPKIPSMQSVRVKVTDLS
jgi:hypothetical protein